jgi:hypothetical protein
MSATALPEKRGPWMMTEPKSAALSGYHHGLRDGPSAHRRMHNIHFSRLTD